MTQIHFVCRECDSASFIDIFSLCSDGFYLICPKCQREFWFTHDLKKETFSVPVKGRLVIPSNIEDEVEKDDWKSGIHKYNGPQDEAS